MSKNLCKIYNEPCLKTLSKMDNESIDCVITSPPYWQLRDYGYEGQWGLEPTFYMYLENLWSMMDEIYRVLKPMGTVWINLGDTYGTQSGNMRNPVKSKETDHAGSGICIKQPKSLHKCLLLLPHRFAIGCIDRGWIVRNDIIWAKRNGMPESVTDRFSKKHEYFFFMVKQEKYYFNLDAIRDKFKDSSIERLKQNIEAQEGSFLPGKTNGKMKAVGNITTKIPSENHELFGSPRARQHRQPKFGGNKGDGNDNGIYSGNEWQPLDKGKNPGSVADFWDIPTKPSSEKHYASYNDELLKKPILAGCPEGGLVYDPFAGTGSTAEVCLRSKRDFIGSEMSVPYCEIAQNRLSHYMNQNQLF